VLRIVLGGEEQWDAEDEVFVYAPSTIVKLEHSLAALSKWAGKFEKPFLTEEDKNNEVVLFYIECMIVDVEDTSSILRQLTQEHIDEIQRYIDSKQTATWFTETPKTRSTQTITTELIYYWMSVAGIDISWENQHLNRLFTLLRVHSAQSEHAANAGKKKKLTADDAARRMAENKRRREMYGSKG